MEQFIQDWGYIALFLYSFGGGFLALAIAGAFSFDGTLNIYITDAGDYVSPGKLYCIDKDGVTKFTVTTGDIPAHFAFEFKTTTIIKP